MPTRLVGTFSPSSSLVVRGLHGRLAAHTGPNNRRYVLDEVHILRSVDARENDLVEPGSAAQHALGLLVSAGTATMLNSGTELIAKAAGYVPLGCTGNIDALHLASAPFSGLLTQRVARV